MQGFRANGVNRSSVVTSHSELILNIARKNVFHDFEAPVGVTLRIGIALGGGATNTEPGAVATGSNHSIGFGLVILFTPGVLS